MARRGPKPKPKPKPRPKNRYQRHSKLSESKFLEVLKGFSELTVSNQIASKTRISEKTVRELTWKIRFRMMDDIMNNRNIFQGIRRYLFDGGKILPRGQRLLDDAGAVDPMILYTMLHRLDGRRLTERHYSALVIENAVRAYCRMAGQPYGLFEMSDELKNTYKIIKDSAEGLAKAEVTAENMQEYEALVAENARLLKDAEEVLDLEQRMAVADAHRSYVSPNQVIYNDLRKSLVKKPL
ncbi:hypothetical protein [Yoonia sp. SS1-5]|uniref:Uncharacterized protein n=1 Tax=Yoonia rhodophyticola TaxID=3137370 RepID=A0AAN0M717_9RHOB